MENQNSRWKKIIDKWVRASRTADTIVIGDLNLDMNKWTDPEYENKDMVDMVKDSIETLNFSQVIDGDTRFWPGVPSSQIDHCWNNCPTRVISTKNVNLALSDHNLLEIKVRISGTDHQPKEIISRDRKNMDIKIYQDMIGKINWDLLYQSTDINIANHIFEEEINKILNSLAPIRVTQIKNNRKSWITKTTRDQMNVRDVARSESKKYSN